MGIIRSLGSLFAALASYWELKKEKFAHDVVTQTRARVEVFEEELETLRDAGSESGTQLADRLRSQLLEEKTHLERVSAFYLETTRGNSSESE